MKTDELRALIEACKKILEAQVVAVDLVEVGLRKAARLYLLDYYMSGNDFFGDRDYIGRLIRKPIEEP